MTRAVIVLPSIHPPTTMGCLATIHPDLIDQNDIPCPPTRQRSTWVATVNGKQWTDGKPDLRLVVVWNTPEHNEGVGQSWEIGRQEVLRIEADWLWIVSAAVRFGPSGGRDFLKQLDNAAGAVIGPTRRAVDAVEADNGLGWHCLAMSRDMVEQVGAFDPIYEVGYYEDVDYSWRYQCANGLTPADYPLWPKVSTDATLVEVAHGIKHGGVTVDMAENQARFVAKWGGVSTQEQWCHPYNRSELDHAFTGPYPAPVE